jgi:mannose-6-phosphate isomerase-like protein (cupin superfamily)
MPSETENKLIKEKLSPDFERTIAYLENLMIVVCDFTNGPMDVPDPPHSHPHEQISYVAEGELLFFKENKEYHLQKGDIITIPSGIKHCIKTLSDHVRLVDSFHPVRKDFLNK